MPLTRTVDDAFLADLRTQLSGIAVGEWKEYHNLDPDNAQIRHTFTNTPQGWKVTVDPVGDVYYLSLTYDMASPDLNFTAEDISDPSKLPEVAHKLFGAAMFYINQS